MDSERISITFSKWIEEGKLFDNQTRLQGSFLAMGSFLIEDAQGNEVQVSCAIIVDDKSKVRFVPKENVDWGQSKPPEDLG